MRIKILILLLILFCLLIYVTTMNLRVEQNKSNEIIPKTDKTESSAFLQKIRDLAKEMEVFPISFIAKAGPLSNWNEGSSDYRRIELTRESFRIFYDFCQLALDATPEDIDACLDYLDDATPREQALLMTAIYIYVYPWESQEPIVVLRKPKWKNSWFSLQFVTNAFDLTDRKNREDDAARRNAYLMKIRESVDDDTIAFPAFTLTESDMKKNSEDYIRCRESIEKLCESIDWTGIVKPLDDFYYFGSMIYRVTLLQKIRERFPEKYKIVIADTLYAFHNDDTRPPMHSFWGSNTNVKAKTVGQVAQQLLKSWPENDSSNSLNNP